MPLDSGAFTSSTSGSAPSGSSDRIHSAICRPVAAASRLDTVISFFSALTSSDISRSPWALYGSAGSVASIASVYPVSVLLST